MHPTDFIRADINEEEFAEEAEQKQVQEDQVDLVQEVPGEDVTDEMLRQDISNPESWLHYNKGHEQIGYSPADRLTPDNIDSLSEAYTIDDYSGNQTEPLIVPGDGDTPPVMYYTKANPQTVTAVNARNGEEFWTFTYSNEDLQGLTSANRGVAVWQDKVYLGSHDNNVVAIDRYTGEKQWQTKTLTQKQQEEMSHPERMANTQAPVIFEGTVLKGMTGYYGGWGAYNALDAETGEIIWQQEIIPEDEWVGESWRYGDASPWNNAAIDPESATVFVPGANPGPMMNGVVRPGPNKHSDSVVAIDIESGDIKWTTQLVAHDWHDYDTYNTRVIEMEVDGETQRVLEAINKTGFLYFLDIETGQLIERTEPYVKQGGEVSFMGILPKGEENKATVWPSDWGATEWTPDSFNPDTGLVHVAANDTVKRYWYSDYEYDETTVETNVGGGLEVVNPEEFPDIGSHIAALDPATGKEVWREDLGSDDSQARAGGTTATGGGVVFGSSPSADLVAVNAESGERLWEQNVSSLPRGITAAPVVWDDPAENTQYVAIASLDGIKVFSVEGQSEGTTAAETETTSGNATDTGNAGGDGNATGTEAGTNAAGETGSSTPGFGAAAGAAGVGGASYAAKKLNDESSDADEGEDDEHSNANDTEDDEHSDANEADGDDA